jgi:excisionase family DNA binding protein
VGSSFLKTTTVILKSLLPLKMAGLFELNLYKCFKHIHAMKDTRPLLLTVREVSMLLRIDRPKVYDLIKNNDISGLKIGAGWRVRRESIEHLVGPIPEAFFIKKGKKELKTQA